MIEYEIFYLVGESKRIELEEVKKSIEEAIVAEGGTMLAGEFVDERRMEYEIRGEHRGIYIAKRFTVKNDGRDIPGAITKRLSFNKSLLRNIIVRTEGLPTLEESQDRVKRVADTRRRQPMNSRFAPSSRPSAPVAATPDTVKVEAEKPALSDTEIDKKLGEVLNI